MFVIFFLILFSYNFSKAQNIDVSQNHSSLEIVPYDSIYAFDDHFYFGVKVKLEKGWKTYWKNPGEAGAPLTIDWENDEEILNKEILFPFPKKYIDHGVETIGYENEIIFPIKLKLKKDTKVVNSKLILQYLVCKEVCIPITTEKKINSKLINSSNAFENSQIFNYYKKVPKNDVNIFSIKNKVLDKKNKINLIIDGSRKKKIEVFAFSKESTLSTHIKKKNQDYLVEIISDDDFNNYRNFLSLVISDGEKYEEIYLNPENIKNNDGKTIFHFIFLAFLGGFILNFMPCVLPVLSLKLLSLLKISKSQFNMLKKNVVFIVLGIFSSFLILAILTIFLKFIGKGVGWGFQFQNYFFLITITIIVLLFSLNLLGFFEIILSSKILNKLNKIVDSNNKKSFFFSGVFATLMATPCSAPFLGTAIGFSSMTSVINIFLIFNFIALGFSLPYIFLLIHPPLLKIIPNPGKWMENFKFFLGLILLFTTTWLMKLIGMEIKTISLVVIVIMLLSLSFYFNFKKLSFCLVGLFFYSLIFLNTQNSPNSSKEWIRFDESLLNSLVAENNLVLLDFTADWCITCQINKKTTLQNEDLGIFIKNNNVKLMRGDWTKTDKEILRFIESFDRLGIPLNVIYGPKNKKGLLLPEILTKDLVIDTLKKVGKNEN